MTAEQFRRLALSFPEAVESSHMNHPDFRVRGGKIFATLAYPDAKWGMVKLTPEQQEEFVRAEPEVFVPVKGGWGRGGATNVRLRVATSRQLRPAMAAAWCNAAPKNLAREFEAAFK
ncbi:MAG: MmcQ/YjbR family DNA-binding protein [Candidatus Acidoferrum typicum]|nr:MmcQ/YjbR family DNA-binding protein [Candidatus Acidoferrum typicum]